MAEQKEKVQDQETTKPGDGKQAELSEQDLEKAVGGLTRKAGGTPLIYM